GSPFDHLASSRNLIVQVLPSSDFSGSPFATPGSGSSSLFNTYNPSKVWLNVKNETWSVANDGSIVGISEPEDKFKTFSDFSLLTPPLPPLSSFLEPPPLQAASVNTAATKIDMSTESLFLI